MNSKSNRTYITTRALAWVSMLVVLITVLGIWLLGLGQHRSLFTNSILSTSILSCAFVLFVTIGLYKGVKLKDDVGSFNDKIKGDPQPNLASAFEFPSSALALTDGLEGIFFGILAWLLMSILLFAMLWLFGVVGWTLIWVFIAMLYWIFFRALRLVFKNANRCKGRFLMSLGYGIGYTMLYNFWIYGIIIGSHYLIV